LPIPDEPTQPVTTNPLAEYAPYGLLTRLIPAGTPVLDIGCGEGHVGGRLRQAGLEVDGLEPDPERAEAARAHLAFVATCGLDGVGEANLPHAAYPVVLFLDVLEHFADPAAALARSRAILTPDGTVFGLVPNSGHWSFRLKVLRGNWRYEDWGLFDKTHLRFFDIHTTRALFEGAGFAVPRVWYFTPAPSRFQQVGCRRWPALFATHTLVEARPS
jgi:SAM-dependent methyltransferase